MSCFPSQPSSGSPVQQAYERVQHGRGEARQLHTRQQVLHRRQCLLLHTYVHKILLKVFLRQLQIPTSK